MDAKEELRECIVDVSIGGLSSESSYHRACEILSTHDLVPVDSGPFRPEDVPGWEFRHQTESGSKMWRNGEWIIYRSDRLSPFTLHRAGNNDFELTLPFWPSTNLALLLLKELGIGGGK